MSSARAYRDLLRGVTNKEHLIEARQRILNPSSSNPNNQHEAEEKSREAENSQNAINIQRPRPPEEGAVSYIQQQGLQSQQALVRLSREQARRSKQKASSAVEEEKKQQKQKEEFLKETRALQSALETTMDEGKYFKILNPNEVHLIYLDKTHALYELTINQLCWEETAYLQVMELLRQLRKLLEAINNRSRRVIQPANEAAILDLAKKAFAKTVLLIQEVIENTNPETNTSYHRTLSGRDYTVSTFKGKKEIELTVAVLEKATDLLDETGNPKNKALALKSAIHKHRREFEGHPIFRKENEKYAAWLAAFLIISGTILLACSLVSPLFFAAGVVAIGSGIAFGLKAGHSPNTRTQEASRDSATALTELNEAIHKPRFF